ncbi:MAG TPA: energy transducer TonB [Nitrospirota bacterium]|nr:energy transducer TonB [Nitrospirota bacterium]
MSRHLHFTKFLLLSLAFHALVFAAVIMLARPAETPLPVITPVKIVNLPREAIKQLPPVEQPVPRRIVPEKPVPRRIVPEQPVPRRIVPERPLPPSAVPMPKKFGKDDEVRLPKTMARTGKPEGSEQGTESGTAIAPVAPHAGAGTGPLPFVSQKEIEELARKGMPEKRQGDDSVTLDTNEFKFISYNRWLKIKVESMLRYPELAAMSGYQGTLYIKFDIMKDGSLGNLELLKSSGYKILDDEALRAIRASAPFQPLPDDWRMERYSIRAAVLFYLNEAYIR